MARPVSMDKFATKKDLLSLERLMKKMLKEHIKSLKPARKQRKQKVES